MMDVNLWRDDGTTFAAPPIEAPRYRSGTTKRLMDIVLASIALVLLLPFFCLIALAIKLDSPGLILFRQARGGLDGRTFSILKFRTLTVMEDGAQITQVSPGDCRVTRVGCFLRRTSIDELPQLVNVIMGDMSLVGPRPHALAHDEMYGRLLPDYTARFFVRPGITGWAQVNGARGPTPQLTDMKRRLDYDIWYIEHWTIGLDARILATTVFAIVAGKMDAF
jgi:lipopolysaccharide/colanic/teichoic acid biosynthesis glycosyltransferase